VEGTWESSRGVLTPEPPETCDKTLESAVTREGSESYSREMDTDDEMICYGMVCMPLFPLADHHNFAALKICGPKARLFNDHDILQKSGLFSRSFKSGIVLLQTVSQKNCALLQLDRVLTWLSLTKPQLIRSSTSKRCPVVNTIWSPEERNCSLPPANTKTAKRMLNSRSVWFSTDYRRRGLRPDDFYRRLDNTYNPHPTRVLACQGTTTPT